MVRCRHNIFIMQISISCVQVIEPPSQGSHRLSDSQNCGRRRGVQCLLVTLDFLIAHVITPLTSGERLRVRGTGLRLR